MGLGVKLSRQALHRDSVKTNFRKMIQFLTSVQKSFPPLNALAETSKMKTDANFALVGFIPFRLNRPWQISL
jgi:hypothetical protein